MIRAFFLAASFLIAFSSEALWATSAPSQPAKGPGGADYAIRASDVVKKAYGQGHEQVFIFRPGSGFAGPRPLIVFLHGYGAISPKIYGAWIEHLVRRGAVVVYPRYQAGIGVARKDITGHAMAGLRIALDALKGEAVALDLEKTAYVGHAAGGIIATNLAILAARENLPAPRLVYAVAPGNSWGSDRMKTPLGDLSLLPESVNIVTVLAETDTIARDTDARKIARQSVNVPINRKMIVKVSTDTHGTPVLTATHWSAAAAAEGYDIADIALVKNEAAQPAPAAPPSGRRGQRPVVTEEKPKPVELGEFGGASVDALDWFAYWKTLDLALAASFAGEDTMPIRRDPLFASMGQWSDGWPVKRLTFETVKEAVPGSSSRP